MKYENVKQTFVYEGTIENLLLRTVEIIKELEAVSIRDVIISFDDGYGWTATIYYIDWW